MSKERIEAFLEGMRDRHADEIDAIELPEGTEAYLEHQLQAGNTEALSFIVKLAYLMGLHAGYAAQHADDTPTSTLQGPLQA
jgi:hypothetical protein